MKPFFIPDQRQQFELEIKRSRFITLVDAAQSRESAMQFLTDCRKQWPDANHHCWAYIAGRPGDLSHADKSDDGEPRGTAGMPMLNVLAHADVGHIAAVVVRYFGGIKLGAGGLVRAYSRCVSEAIGCLTTRLWFDTRTVTINLPYALLDRVEHLLANTMAVVTDRDFGAAVTLTVAVPLHEAHGTVAALETLGRGEIEIS